MNNSAGTSTLIELRSSDNKASLHCDRPLSVLAISSDTCRRYVAQLTNSNFLSARFNDPIEIEAAKKKKHKDGRKNRRIRLKFNATLFLFPL